MIAERAILQMLCILWVLCDPCRLVKTCLSIYAFDSACWFGSFLPRWPQTLQTWIRHDNVVICTAASKLRLVRFEVSRIVHSGRAYRLLFPTEGGDVAVLRGSKKLSQLSEHVIQEECGVEVSVRTLSKSQGTAQFLACGNNKSLVCFSKCTRVFEHRIGCWAGAVGCAKFA